MLKALPLYIKLLLLVILPIVAMLSIEQVLTHTDITPDQERFEEVRLCLYLSDIIHELQKERGLTIGHLSNESVVNNELMAAQQDSVDQLLFQIERIDVSFFKGQAFKGNFKSDLLKIREEANQLKNKFQNERLIVKIFERYSEFIHKLVDTLFLLAHNSNYPLVVKIIDANTHLQLAKENLGIVRVWILKGLLNGELQVEEQTKVWAAKGKYDLELNLFFKKIDFEEENLSAILSRRKFDETSINNLLNSIAYDNGQLPPIDPLQWWSESTQTIDYLGKIEHDVLLKAYNNYAELISQRKDERQTLFMFLVLTLLILLGFIVWLIFDILKTAGKPL